MFKRFVSWPERALLKKDFLEIWNSRMAKNTLLLLPICLAVVLPAVYLVLILIAPLDDTAVLEQMRSLVAHRSADMNPQQVMFEVMSNVIGPLLFLLIPLLSSCVTAACSFVGERERGTIETLLLTPLRVKQVLKAKALCCISVSVLASALSFLAFTFVIAVGDILLKVPFFFGLRWLVLILLVTPACVVLGVLFMAVVSGKSRSYVESFQTSAYLILPVVLLFLGQFTGLYTVTAWGLLIFGLFVAAADVALWRMTKRSFTPEKLLRA